MADLSLPIPLTSPTWLQAMSADAADSVDEILRQALNSSAHRERWKYTKAAPILAVVAETGQAPIVEGTEQPGIHVSQTALTEPMAGFDLQQAPEALARLCYAKQVIIIDVDQPTAQPIRLQHGQSTLPVLIRLKPNATLTLLENSDNQSQMQQTLWIDLGQNARLEHSRNAFNASESHWQYLNVRLQQHAQYQLYNHVAGCTLRRQDVHLIMDGQGSEASLSSAGRVGQQAALDQQITVEHRQPGGRSNQTIHNIVADGGKCTFNGRIHIHEGASGTDAQLSNKNLGMGDHATINTKPELEIYTDDVSCSHGATVGTLSQEALFYLTSRGVAPEVAEALLSQGFLRQCINGPMAEAALNALVGTSASS